MVDHNSPPTKTKKRTPKVTNKDLALIIDGLDRGELPKDIAPHFGITKSYVNKIKLYYLEVKSRYQVAQVADTAVVKAQVEDRLIRDVSRIQESITAGDILAATLKDKVWAIGVLFDKHRLATGQSTSNVNTLATIVERMDHARRYPNATGKPEPITVKAEDVTIKDAPTPGDPDSIL